MKLFKSIFLLFLIFSSSIILGQQNDNLWMRYTAISPDGSTIAFSYNADIYAVATNGGKATRLTTHSAYDAKPVWSHDGSKIAFFQIEMEILMFL